MSVQDQFMGERDSGADRGIDYYFGVFKHRFLFFVIPFTTIAVLGAVVAYLWPAIYSSRANILVESQQIPSDLVRSTVTTSANERIQVIEQRVLSRDNLLAIAQKLNVFEERRKWISVTDVVDLMRERTSIEPLALDPSRGRRTSNALIAFTVAFEHERPATAMKVANELVTLILNEDVRTRTRQANETTRFLSQEVKRLEEELTKIEAQISEFERRRLTGQPDDDINKRLALLKADLVQKGTVYSDTHPEMQVLKQQIAVLEQQVRGTGKVDQENVAQQSEVETTLRGLIRHQGVIQANLAEVRNKLMAARVGERLEVDRHSERFEVIEQPAMPQEPVRPDRRKILALALGLAFMAGIGGVFAVETLDKTIRDGADLVGIVHGSAVVAIPYIRTRAEEARWKQRMVWSIAGVIAFTILGLVVVHFFILPLDLLFLKVLVKLHK